MVLFEKFEFSPNILDHFGPVQNDFGPTQGPGISLPLIGRRLVSPNSCLLMQCVPNGNRYYWDINSERSLFFYKLRCQYSFLVICQNFFTQKKKKLLFYRIYSWGKCINEVRLDSQKWPQKLEWFFKFSLDLTYRISANSFRPWIVSSLE